MVFGGLQWEIWQSSVWINQKQDFQQLMTIAGMVWYFVAIEIFWMGNSKFALSSKAFNGKNRFDFQGLIAAALISRRKYRFDSRNLEYCHWFHQFVEWIKPMLQRIKWCLMILLLRNFNSTWFALFQWDENSSFIFKFSFIFKQIPKKLRTVFL